MYIGDARQLLQAFEQTQSELLELNLKKSLPEFIIEFQEMRNLFSSQLAELNQKEFNQSKEKLLLTGQLNRLLNILKEMNGHITSLQSDKNSDKKKILFVFYRQHMFKNIYRRHLADYIRITST